MDEARVYAVLAGVGRMNVLRIHWLTAPIAVGILLAAAPVPAAKGDDMAGPGDAGSNMPYIDSDPDEVVMGNPSVMIEVDGYHAGWPTCWNCDELGDYACSPFGTYPGWGWPSKVGFVDPLPAGYIVTRVEATVNGVFCQDTAPGGTGLITVIINETTIGSGFQFGHCLCGTCDPLTVMAMTYPCGLPGYEYGGNNQLALLIDGVSCITDVHLQLFYVPIPAPVCDANGPYASECQGDWTDVALDGSGSYDPCDVPFTYSWTTDCPGGSFDDNTLAMPTLTADSVGPCPLVCNVDLTVDNGDATDNCASTVTIEDTTAPSISCPAGLAIECDESTDPANTGTATATDACDASPDATHADVETPGPCAQDHTITRTWTATDDCGNPSTCDQTISVVDTTVPTFTETPIDTTVECDGNYNMEELSAWLNNAAATDNCGTVTIFDDSGIVFLELFDNGNAQGWDLQSPNTTANPNGWWTIGNPVGTYVQGIPAQPEDPYLGPGCAYTGPNPDGLFYDGDVDGGITYLISPTIDLSGRSTANLLYARWFYERARNDGHDDFFAADVSDDNGANWVNLETVTMTLTDPPSNLWLPRSFQLEDFINLTSMVKLRFAAQAQEGAIPDDTVEAAVDEVYIVGSPVGFMPGCSGTGTRTFMWTARDDCGNVATTSASFTIVDTTAPVLTVPANVTIECDEPSDPSNTGVATATDTCDPAPLVTWTDVSSGTCPEVITRTWRATDACDNSTSGDQLITVDDTTAPVLAGTPGDVTVECDNVPAPPTVTATDNCDTAVNVTFDEVRTDGNCPDNYTLTRTWSATDNCGNPSVHVQTITVQDTVAPTVTCPPDAAVTVPDPTDPSATGIATATDACDASPVINWSDVEAFLQFCPTISVITRTWTAFDGCDNQSSCDQLIEVTEPLPEGMCCNPANGTLTLVDDGDECTSDICNEATGEVTHPDNGLCNPCCGIDGPGTCEEVFAEDCPNPAGYFVGETCEGDNDGDGFADVCDTCPGVDDAVYGPCDPDTIPTVSTWGMIILTLLLLAAGKVYFGLTSRGLQPARIRAPDQR